MDDIEVVEKKLREYVENVKNNDWHKTELNTFLTAGRIEKILDQLGVEREKTARYHLGLLLMTRAHTTDCNISIGLSNKCDCGLVRARGLLSGKEKTVQEKKNEER